jgi:hypothetical protein
MTLISTFCYTVPRPTKLSLTISTICSMHDCFLDGRTTLSLRIAYTTGDELNNDECISAKELDLEKTEEQGKEVMR